MTRTRTGVPTATAGWAVRPTPGSPAGGGTALRPCNYLSIARQVQPLLGVRRKRMSIDTPRGTRDLPPRFAWLQARDTSFHAGIRWRSTRAPTREVLTAITRATRQPTAPPFVRRRRRRQSPRPVPRNLVTLWGIPPRIGRPRMAAPAAVSLLKTTPAFRSDLLASDARLAGRC